MEEDNMFTEEWRERGTEIEQLVHRKHILEPSCLCQGNIPKWRKGKGISTLGVPAACSKLAFMVTSKSLWQIDENFNNQMARNCHLTNSGAPFFYTIS